MLRTLVATLLAFSDRNKPFNWTMHGVIVALIVGLFWLCGAPHLGAWVGGSIYLWREAEAVGKHWAETGIFYVSTDNLGDLIGPALVVLATAIFL